MRYLRLGKKKTPPKPEASKESQGCGLVSIPLRCVYHKPIVTGGWEIGKPSRDSLWLVTLLGVHHLEQLLIACTGFLIKRRPGGIPRPQKMLKASRTNPGRYPRKSPGVHAGSPDPHDVAHANGATKYLYARVMRKAPSR